MKAQNEAEALEHMDASWRGLGNQLSGVHKQWVQAKLRALQIIHKELDGLRSVLEMGVGDGAYWELFDPFRYADLAYVGVDGSELILEAARKRSNWCVFVQAPFGEFIKLHVPDTQLVVALDVIYHLPTQELHDAFIAWLFGPGQHQYVLASWATDTGQAFSNARRPGEAGFAWFARDVAIPYEWECIHTQRADGVGMPQKQGLGVFKRRG